ncbi:MAG TPA: ATPase, T2SS/T4P/T4SS family [Burkholderiaceae bacterium]|nr:ATPase, T2SS/T4P/T4SS family [Burkholderiaceae bacterium]
MLLGELLIQTGRISEADLANALRAQASLGLKLGAILVRLGALSEESLYAALEEQLGLPLIEVDALIAQSAAVAEMVEASATPLAWFEAQQVAVWRTADGTVFAAAADPLMPMVAEHVSVVIARGSPVHWRLARPGDLERLFAAQRSATEQTWEVSGDELARLRELAQEAPVIELVNALFAAAVASRASDVHIEPQAHGFAVRLRIDGVLHTHQTYPKDRLDALVCRIKLVSNLDIAERRVPQDGRVTVRASGKEVDVRISVIPGVHGESIVMRLLPKTRSDLDLTKLGMADDHRARFAQWIRDPNGIVLVTGPTGSGKSTTLYTALALANDGQRKIITVEDPVEFQLAGVTQIQVHSEIGYTFARALRSILRHDPDIIMVGEIRDRETAEIAVQSALTGHMVFSTLHTNDAVGAFTRLVDMGVEPFLVASALRGVIAQRLVRRVCDHCARPQPADPLHDAIVRDVEARQAARHALGSQAAAPARWRVASGCAACNNTGYRGRLGIYELISVTPTLQTAINAKASTEQLHKIAAAAPGYRSLRDDGLYKARAGWTTIDEVLRVTGLPEDALA